MAVKFSKHAKSQFKRRHIKQDDVLEIIHKPDEIVSSFRRRKLRRKRFGDKLLEVVTKTEGSRITVITAYYLEAKK